MKSIMVEIRMPDSIADTFNYACDAIKSGVDFTVGPPAFPGEREPRPKGSMIFDYEIIVYNNAGNELDGVLFSIERDEDPTDTHKLWIGSRVAQIIQTNLERHREP